jgi:hypothetical protein
MSDTALAIIKMANLEILTNKKYRNSRNIRERQETQYLKDTGFLGLYTGILQHCQLSAKKPGF